MIPDLFERERRDMPLAPGAIVLVGSRNPSKDASSPRWGVSSSVRRFATWSRLEATGCPPR